MSRAIEPLLPDLFSPPSNSCPLPPSSLSMASVRASVGCVGLSHASTSADSPCCGESIRLAHNLCCDPSPHSDTQPAFKVTQWGCLFDVSMALHLWLRLTLAYQYAGLPKQHADAARAYLVKVYAMVFGETASFAWSSIEDWGYRLMVRELESHGLLLAL